jgi:hypothetical protein
MSTDYRWRTPRLHPIEGSQSVSQSNSPESRFLSVFLRVHPWLTPLFNCMVPAKCARPPGLLDCGGKRSATPLSYARRRFETSTLLMRSKAPSTFHSAGAVHDDLWPTHPRGVWERLQVRREGRANSGPIFSVISRHGLSISHSATPGDAPPAPPCRAVRGCRPEACRARSRCRRPRR